MISDAHCHLDHLVDGYKIPAQVKPIVDDAKNAGVGLMITCGTDLDNSKQVVEIINNYGEVYGMVGSHPWWIKERLTDKTFEEFRGLLRNQPKVLGVGEIGLDFEQAPTTINEQTDALRGFVRLAKEVKLPLNLHCRPQQYSDMLAILREEGAQEVSGMIHGFQGDETVANEFLQLGFYISLGHFLFWPGREPAQAAAKKLPLDKIVIETDSPVGPEPNVRGRPALLKGVAERVSDLLGLPMDKLAETTNANLGRLCSSRLKMA